MSETILQMPCLSCEPPCLWPIDPPQVIRVSVFFMQNSGCSSCVFLNGQYFPEFTQKTIIPGSVICEWESPFLLPVCGIVKALFFSRVFPATNQNFMGFSFRDEFDNPVFSWDIFLNPPESMTNGPFFLDIVVAQILTCFLAGLFVEVDVV